MDLGGAPSVSAVLPGAFTVATLPAASGAQARYAFVTDLGGGADMVLSDGVNWKHIRPGVLTDVALVANLALTALASPPMIRLTGSGLTGANSISYSNVYPGYVSQFLIPSGLLGALATLGVALGSGGAPIPLVAGTWAWVQWTGTTSVKIAGGTL